MAVENIIGLYGALLSTLIVIVAVIRWALSGPRLLVTVYNPQEYWCGDDRFGIVVTNVGSVSTVVARLEILFFGNQKKSSDPIHSQVIDQSSQMSPSMEKVPDRWKENTYSFSPNILKPGDEYLAVSSAEGKYDPDIHWILVKAYPRGMNRFFSGWAEPMEKGAPNA